MSFDGLGRVICLDCRLPMKFEQKGDPAKGFALARFKCENCDAIREFMKPPVQRFNRTAAG